MHVSRWRGLVCCVDGLDRCMLCSVSMCMHAYIVQCDDVHIIAKCMV